MFLQDSSFLAATSAENLLKLFQAKKSCRPGGTNNGQPVISRTSRLSLRKKKTILFLSWSRRSSRPMSTIPPMPTGSDITSRASGKLSDLEVSCTEENWLAEKKVAHQTRKMHSSLLSLELFMSTWRDQSFSLFIFPHSFKNHAKFRTFFSAVDSLNCKLNYFTRSWADSQ